MGKRKSKKNENVTHTKSKKKDATKDNVDKNSERTEEKEQNMSRKDAFVWVCKGVASGYTFNLGALLPLLFVKQLKEDNKARDYYLVGCLPFILKRGVQMTLQIINNI